MPADTLLVLLKTGAIHHARFPNSVPLPQTPPILLHTPTYCYQAGVPTWQMLAMRNLLKCMLSFLSGHEVDPGISRQ